ncbi:class II aldolase/adducin family protein [Desulfoluna sp.]|uniref:class II aldolase/adducin family protein n=1 Tax=Desulfoluna sp. TaxID=2045199 RepID=UPI002623E1DA|nr:class II aldolase/adducin family protein [Desulfoluna sp.]
MDTYVSIKQEVLDAALWLSENHYFGTQLSSGGNVSARVPGKNLFAITPSSVPYHELTSEEICLLDFDLHLIEGDLKPSIEAGMHATLYTRRPDVNAVAHTHQFHASIFAVLNTPIPPLFDEIAMLIGHQIAVIPYALSGSDALAAQVGKSVTNGCSCFIMQNHGALNLGRDLKQAMRNAELLEKAARVYHHALSTGLPITTLPAEALHFWEEIRQTL